MLGEEYQKPKKITYKDIQDYIKGKYDFFAHSTYISEVKRECGLDVHEPYNAIENPIREYHCTEERKEQIKSDDADLTDYLWPIVCEMIKTTIENKQNLIIEGCYIPFDWSKDFEEEYLDYIRYYCLVLSEDYIRNHFADIKRYASVIENRLDDEGCTLESVLKDNSHILELAKKHNVNYVLIDDKYEIDINL